MWYNPSMKRLLIALVVVLVVSGVTVALAWRYSITQHKKDVAQTTAIEQAISATNKKIDQLKAVQAQTVQRLLAECQKGVVTYDSLPVAAKAKITAPICKAS